MLNCGSEEMNKKDECGWPFNAPKLANAKIHGEMDKEGKTTTNTSSSPEECVVCGAIASGVHYLVWACNGCKTFFRRAIMENRKYSCRKEGNCGIDVKNRCGCRHCRFQKCIQKGMKFTEINVDRKRRIRGIFGEIEELMEENKNRPLVRELLAKEQKMRELVGSSSCPIYGNLEEAMDIFGGQFDWEGHRRDRTEEKRIFERKLTFNDWRERILSATVEWAKSFLKSFPRAEQEALIVHSAFPLMVFSEAFHTPERYSDRLVFPDGLQVTRNFSRGIFIEKNGLNRAMVAIINDILAPIRRIQLSEVEYAFIRALILFDSDCLSLTAQSMEIVTRERDKLIENLAEYLDENCGKDKLESANRMAQLILRIPRIHKVAEFKRQFFIEHSTSTTPHSPLAIDLATKYPSISFF